MPSNYVLLRKTTLTTSTASVTFSDIPQTGYTDLKVVASVRSTKADITDYIYFTFSGSSSYAATKVLFGSGASAGSFNWSTVSGITGGIINAASNTASTFSSVDIYIPNYTASQYKSVSIDTVQEGNTGSNIYATMMAGLSNSNTAISTITFACETGNFVADSEFSLYGIAAVGTTPALAPFATGGDIVTNDGTYWIHTFLSSGTFTPAKTLTCDYLVVAGGAGGGSYGGGGGAGGLRSTVTATGGSGSLETALSLNAGNYAVYVGAGGAGGTSSAAQSGSKKGVAGSDSIFATITSLGGGSGLGFNENTSALANGGSGGGGADSPGSNQYINGGTGNSNQGYAGGRGYRTNSGYNACGGGGGAASAGGDGSGSGSSPVGGTAGSGRSIAISGSSVTYASGGVGMAEAGSDAAGASGTANRGIGGGGSTGVGANRLAGGNGGSGIVIVRYPMV
jgi:hypothetical protein